MSTPTKSGLTRAAMRRAGAAELVTKEAAVEQLYDVIQAAVQNDNAQARRHSNTKTSLQLWARCIAERRMNEWT
jgi:FixJ family two-component response regulator